MKTRRRGSTLLLVIVAIGMTGITSLVMARTVASTWNDTRRTELAVRARQALASGVEWAARHRSECAALAEGASRTIDAAALAPDGGAVTLTVTRSAAAEGAAAGAASILRVRAVASLGKLAERAEAVVPRPAE